MLADLYLTQIDRALTRAGRVAYRHNDECRIPVEREHQAGRVLVELEEQLRKLGLVLNAAKTRVPTRAQYERALEALEDRLAEARESATQAVLETGAGGFYGFDPETYLEADWSGLPVDEVEAAFERAVKDDDSDQYPGVSDRVIVDCLPPLAQAKSAVPLSHVRPLVRERPWLIRDISLYLRGLAGSSHEREMMRSVSALLRSPVYPLPWIRGWLIDPLAHCESQLPGALRQQVELYLRSDRAPWFVRGRAAVVLGTEGRLPGQPWMSGVFEEAPPSARADFVAAIAIADPPWGDAFLRSPPPLWSLRMEDDWCSQQRSKRLP